VGKHVLVRDPFDVIVIDPPWDYRNKKTGGSMKSGARDQYRTMSFRAIADLQERIRALSHPGTVCFLWITTPIKQLGSPLLKLWGFEYKTTLYWRKNYPGRQMGMGFWFRGEVEELQLGVGKKAVAFRHQEPNFIETPPLGHSKKPDEFQALIERATPDARRLEIFPTRTRDGWTCIGDNRRKTSHVILSLRRARNRRTGRNSIE